jgi:hypothetical protein
LRPYLGIVVVALLLSGCGDDGGSPEPVIGVDIPLDVATLEIAETLDLTANVSGGESKVVDWYVDGILGGNSEVGTVATSSPATYTAPDAVPEPATVVVKAVSRENENMMDSCLVTIQFTMVHVDASTGNDDTGTGSLADPLKSITAGLGIAESGMTVLAAAGLYDAANGEVFPLEVPDSVSLVGEDWENTVIRGHSETAIYHHTVWIPGDESSLRKFTIEEGEVIEEHWDLVVYVDGATGALLDSIRVLDRSDFGVFRVWYATETRIENCYLGTDDGYTMGHGIEFNTDEGNTVIKNCTAMGFYMGIALNNTANPLIEGCTIEENAKGVYLCCPSLPDHNPNPDLGGGARNSSGGNIIRDNTSCGVENGSSYAVYAKFNTWTNDPPIEGIDFCNTGTGSVIWE